MVKLFLPAVLGQQPQWRFWAVTDKGLGFSQPLRRDRGGTRHEAQKSNQAGVDGGEDRVAVAVAPSAAGRA